MAREALEIQSHLEGYRICIDVHIVRGGNQVGIFELVRRNGESGKGRARNVLIFRKKINEEFNLAARALGNAGDDFFSGFNLSHENF